ncbi:hypothetical protein NM688_g3403 [Phlebia brevispora]|uniref:Uncharacterized protein n=1 Tax=Phlebia brevispora TaxID=194682 RepID=A0ACC1T5Z3_9APHY|nr:hypothetical protein NM688_g3403 [Phlebia brevispora]
MWYKRISADDIGPKGPTYLIVFFAFQIAAGHVALSILALTMLLAKSMKKRPLLINICVTWILAAVCFSLLFYAGQYRGPEPNSDLCIGQASLIGAIPILTCTATFIVACHLWHVYDDPEVHEYTSRHKRLTTFSQLVIPYIAFGIFVAIGAAISVQHPDKVDREQRYFYCSLDWNSLTYAVDFLSAILCLMAAALEAHIVSVGFRRWRLSRRAGVPTDQTVFLHIRIFVFTLYLLGSTMVNLVSNWVEISVVPDLLLASVGAAFFVIFATQKDVISAWRFWRRPRRAHVLHVSSPTTNPLVPILRAKGETRDLMTTDRSSKNTYSSSMLMKDYYETKARGVEIIGRPEDAFRERPGEV